MKNESEAKIKSKNFRLRRPRRGAKAKSLEEYDSKQFWLSEALSSSVLLAIISGTGKTKLKLNCLLNLAPGVLIGLFF